MTGAYAHRSMTLFVVKMDAPTPMHVKQDAAMWELLTQAWLCFVGQFCCITNLSEQNPAELNAGQVVHLVIHAYCMSILDILLQLISFS